MATLADLQRAPGAAVPAPAGLALPGLTGARTVDTPEFRGMTFLEVQTKTALNKVTGMPFPWSINLYRGCQHACKYCFARPTHTYLNLSATEDFDSTIVVKTNIVEVLRAELARPSWKGQHVALGTNTDPYQRAEGRYGLMPGVIAALAKSYTPFSILTKGTLITRDIEALQQAAQRVPVTASMTIGMLDEGLWHAVEPGTPSPRARLEAVRRLNQAGIPTGVMLAPIMPRLNDGAAQLAELTQAAADAGATHITPITLHLRPGVKEAFWPWLQAQHPELVAHYTALYGAPGTRGRSSLPKPVAEPLLRAVRQARDVAWRRRGDPPDRGAWPDPRRPGEQITGHRVARRPIDAGAAEQLALLSGG
ncbi:MAG TPA: radical SAM protein [Euzebya sp.]|nr:radical SAM protein [Euzebya sp.]